MGLELRGEDGGGPFIGREPRGEDGGGPFMGLELRGEDGGGPFMGRELCGEDGGGPFMGREPGGVCCADLEGGACCCQPGKSASAGMELKSSTRLARMDLAEHTTSSSPLGIARHQERQNLKTDRHSCPGTASRQPRFRGCCSPVPHRAGHWSPGCCGRDSRGPSPTVRRQPPPTL